MYRAPVSDWNLLIWFMNKVELNVDCFRDISYVTTIHDLKLLLLRFARGKSFHEDTGGGGPQSNMQIVPYLMHMALYVINT